MLKELYRINELLRLLHISHLFVFYLIIIWYTKKPNLLVTI
jgi:hypothetical protein